MRSWLGLVIVVILWAACGRLDLDAPYDGASAGTAGTTGSAGTGAAGTIGRGGVTGAAGSSAAGTTGRGGTTGAAGSSAAGTTGRGGTTGAAGSSAAGTTGRGGTTGAAGSSAAGSTGRGGTTGAAGSSAAGTTGRGGTTGAAGSSAAGTTGRGGTTGAAGSSAAGTTGRGGTTGAAGSGAAGTTGVGGTGVGPMACVPGRSEACACATGAQGAQVCRADGTFGPCVCVSSEFQRIRDGMVGTWVGQETNPWTAAFQVRITFGADGHYSGHCAQASCPATVFYYGSDDDSPLKTYELVDLRDNGTGLARINIYFGPTNVNEGDLDAITLSADAQQLDFEFWATWGGRFGPLVFRLKRVP